MHKLLKRQINKVFGESFELPEHCLPIIELINRTYEQNEEDKTMLERMLEITSDEMRKLYNKQKDESNAAINLADERLRLATIAAHVGVWEMDIPTGTVFWDNITYTLYGLSHNANINAISAWQQCVHPDDQLMAASELKNALRGDKEFDIEYRVIWPDKTIHYLRTKGIVQYDENGNKVKMIGTKWDITERVKAQMSMNREKELSDSMINSLPGIFFLFTKEGKMLKWNNNLCDVTGYTKEEIADMHPLNFFDTDEKEKISVEIGKVLTNGQSDTEANLFTKEKKKIPFFFNSITVNYNGSDCVLGTAINIEERKKAEERLKAKNKDLEEFAYIVSHNLRAPIAKIQGLASLINSNKDEKDIRENLNMLDYIKDEVINLDKIIQEMNLVIRERDYITFKPKTPHQNETYVNVKNVYLIDDDPVVNIISKKIIEKTGFAGKINVHQSAVKVIESLKILCEQNVNDFPELIFLDINMPVMNGWEFLDEFIKLKEEARNRCQIYMLTSSIDPSDMKKSQTYSCVKDFITKPLTKEKLEKLNL